MLNLRAWDNETKTMSYGKVELYDDSLNFRFKHFGTNEVVFMLASPFTDADGKLIFDKDILVVQNGIDNWYYLVEYRDGAFYVVSYVENVNVLLSDFLKKCEVKVAGNKYQNKELLRHLFQFEDSRFVKTPFKDSDGNDIYVGDYVRIYGGAYWYGYWEIDVRGFVIEKDGVYGVVTGDVFYPLDEVDEIIKVIPRQDVIGNTERGWYDVTEFFKWD